MLNRCLFSMHKAILVSCEDYAAIVQGHSPFSVVSTAQEGSFIFLHVKIGAWVGVGDNSFATSCPIFDFTDVCRFAGSRLPFHTCFGQRTLASLAGQPIFEVRQICFVLEFVRLYLNRLFPALHINLLTLRCISTIAAEVLIYV